MTAFLACCSRCACGMFAVLTALLMAAPGTRAAHIASDFFESYAAPTNLNGGGGGIGWTSDWDTTAGHVTVQAKHLQAGFSNGQTQASRIQPTANIILDDSVMTRAFSASTGPVYLSFLLRVENYGPTDLLQIQVSDGAVGNNSATLSVGINQAGILPFFARVGVTGNTTNSTVGVQNNTDYFLVAKFSKDGSSFFNRTDLYLNPLGREESSHTPIATFTQDPAGTGLTQLSLFNVRVQSIETNDPLFLDNIRIGDSFASVTPASEPPSLAMLSIGLGALAVGGRSAWRRRPKTAA